jgi:hypothetical protein
MIVTGIAPAAQPTPPGGTASPVTRKMSEVTPRAPQPHPSMQARNRAATRRDWSNVEQYLSDVEKAHGWDRAWGLRERLERGDVTLKELTRR